jgi:predicted RNA binding protein YcfA (HicA-like mRNA interferase family)
MPLPELPATTAKRLVAALKRLGFYEVRQTGSHLQLKRGNLLVTVPMRGRDLSRSVLKSVLRQARLSVEELKEVL